MKLSDVIFKDSPRRWQVYTERQVAVRWPKRRIWKRILRLIQERGQ